MSSQTRPSTGHPQTPFARGHTTSPLLFPIVCLLLITLTLLTRLHAADAPAPVPQPTLYVFISASIPKASLLEIAKDAVSYHAPLLLRGLVGSSLQETLLTLKDLVALGAGLEVDPLLFEAYGVEAVPAVVLTCGTRGDGPYAITYGLPPTPALPILRKALPRC